MTLLNDTLGPTPPRHGLACSSVPCEPSQLWAEDSEQVPLTHGSLSISQAHDFHKIALRVHQIKSFLGRMEAVERLEKLNENPHIMQIQQGKIKKNRLTRWQCRK